MDDNVNKTNIEMFNSNMTLLMVYSLLHLVYSYFFTSKINKIGLIAILFMRGFFLQKSLRLLLVPIINLLKLPISSQARNVLQA